MLKQYIVKNKNFETLFLIGPNGVGKTYNLLQEYKQDTTKNIYISEDGLLENITYKNKIKLDLNNNLYIFEVDEHQRGNRNTENISKIVEINKRLLELLHFCDKEKDNIKKIQKKSKGQIKMLKILEILTSIYLDPISIVLIDEPENYLDDNYLKIIAKLVNLLKKSEIQVIIATHSPRLCELCDMNIDNVILMDIKNIDGSIEYIHANLTTQEVKEIYKNVSKEIQEIAKNNKYNQDAGILKKLNMSENNILFDNLLNHLLKSEEFYRILFYKDIFLVEGETEKIIFKKLYKNMAENSHFFTVNGKVFLPFFVNVFIKLNKNLKVVLDSDRKPDKKYTTAVAITDYFEKNYKNTCRIFEYDLESNFGIDLDKFRRDNGFSKGNQFMIKQFASAQFFKDEINLRNFINFIK